MTDAWVTAFLVFVRLAALIQAMPVLTALGVPRYVGILLAFAVTWLVAPGVPLVEAPEHLGTLAIGVASELVLGASLGLVVRAAFSSLAIASDIVGQQAGFSMGTQLDPMLQLGQSSLGILASWLAGVVFLSSHQHLILLVAASRSFVEVPPGGLTEIGGLAEAMVLAMKAALIVGVQLASPLIALMFTINVCLGVLGRLAPKMNVFFSLGMTVNGALGIWLFGLALPFLLETHATTLEGAFETVGAMIQSAGR